MFKNYFRTAVRNLLHNQTYSLINIAGLSLGLVCAMLIMLYVKDEVSYDRFHKNVQQIYRIDRKTVRKDGSANYGSYTGYFPGPRFAAKIPEIQSYVRFQPIQMDVRMGADVQSQPVCLVDSSFFTVLSFPLLSGDPKKVLTQPDAVVITEEMAKKYYGKADALGKTLSINVNGKFIPYLVTGVAKNCPLNSSIKFDVLLPLTVSKEDESNNENWFNYFLTTLVVLAPHTNVHAVEAKMDRAFESDARQTINAIKAKYGIEDIGFSFAMEPLSAIHLGQMVSAQDEILAEKSNPVYSYILSAIAFFIFLIACINFVNLTVARSVKRAKEIGVRKVIGGTRKQLVVQFLSESFILSLIAFSVAIFIVISVLPLFNQLSNKALSFSYLLDARLVAGYILLFLLTGLLAGFYPAIVLSSYHPVQTLYSRFQLAGKSYLQKSLVVFQFALASFLIIATMTIFLQLNYLTSQSLGYDDHDLVTVNKGGLDHKEGAFFKSALLKDPDILGVALKNTDFSNNTVQVNGNQGINVVIENVDYSYLLLLKVPIVSGRNFSPDYPADSSQSVLVNEAFAKEAGWSQALGKRVSSLEDGRTYIVAGLVKDYHYKDLTEKIGPQIFFLKPKASYGTVYIKVKRGTETKSLRFISARFKELFPLGAFSYAFKEEQNAASYQKEARWKQILLSSAVLTILISCMGLFGLSVLAAEKRTKEIGIRKVLGASITNVVSILSTDFLRLVLLSLVISMPLAWMVLARWLQNYPYRIKLDWWIFTSSGILVIFIASFTISFQSFKAAAANPVKSLRSE
jgi:putative ABC transport system permease protein